MSVPSTGDVVWCWVGTGCVVVWGGVVWGMRRGSMFSVEGHRGKVESWGGLVVGSSDMEGEGGYCRGVFYN